MNNWITKILKVGEKIKSNIKKKIPTKKEQADSKWISCSSGPKTTYPGIVKRGVRERSWIETKAEGVGDNLVDKLSEKINLL